MLAVENLSVDIGGVHILLSVSFAAKPGELVVLLGPNGCGKSTLIKTIIGLCKISGGNIFFGERDISIEKRKKRARIFAHMSQNTSSSSSFTVLETVIMGRYPYLTAFGHYTKNDFEMSRSAIEKVGLSGFENRAVSSLSGGEAARAALARTLAQDTPVLLLDEPLSSLDPGHSMAVTDVLKSLTEAGKLLIVSMHDVNMALNHSDRIILLRGGRVVGDMPSRKIGPDALEDLYGIPWEIWKSPNGHSLAVPE